MPAGYKPKLLPGQEPKSVFITTTLTKTEFTKLHEWMEAQDKPINRSEAVRSMVLTVLGLPNDRV